MKTYDQMAQDALARIYAYRSARKKKIKAGAISAGCLCLAAVVSFGVMHEFGGSSRTILPAVTATAPTTVQSKPTVSVESKAESVESTPQSVVESKPESKPAQKPTGGGTYVDTDYPTFLNQQSFQKWLATGEGDFAPELRQQFFKATNSTNSITYCWPQLDKLPKEFLQNDAGFTVYPTFGYLSFVLTDNSKTQSVGLDIVCRCKNCGNDTFLFSEKDRGEHPENYATFVKNGITYYVQYNRENPDKNRHIASIEWLQYGVSHHATLYGHEDQLDQILEVLNLQPVSVKIEK